MARPHILYAVLNWGLGHATRSIPVIRTCLEMDLQVTIASDGFPLRFLRSEFPGLPGVELPEYHVTYEPGILGRHAWMLFRSVQTAIRWEHKVMLRLQEEHNFDAVISDNRYGCSIPGVPSALLSHQFRIVGSSRVGNALGSRALRKWTRPFDYLWVPDTREHLLSGKMSDVEDRRLRHVGPLSTLTPASGGPRRGIACILSGPEPSRSNLEKVLTRQLMAADTDAILVRGVDEPNEYTGTGRLRVTNHASRQGIGEIMAQSEVVICRPGYSSIMDLLAVGRKAILIPTPQQPEQEYLGRKFSSSPHFCVQSEDRISLEKGLDHLAGQPDPPVILGNEADLRVAISELLWR